MEIPTEKIGNSFQLSFFETEVRVKEEYASETYKEKPKRGA